MCRVKGKELKVKVAFRSQEWPVFWALVILIYKMSKAQAKSVVKEFCPFAANSVSYMR